jgi:hypothetical protein
MSERKFGDRREFLVRWVPSEALLDKANWVPEKDLHCDAKLRDYFHRRQQILAQPPPRPLVPTMSDVAPGKRIIAISAVVAAPEGGVYVVETEDGADWMLPSRVVRAEALQLLADYLEALAEVMGPDVAVDAEGLC